MCSARAISPGAALHLPTGTVAYALHAALPRTAAEVAALQQAAKAANSSPQRKRGKCVGVTKADAVKVEAVDDSWAHTVMVPAISAEMAKGVSDKVAVVFAL